MKKITKFDSDEYVYHIHKFLKKEIFKVYLSTFFVLLFLFSNNKIFAQLPAGISFTSTPTATSMQYCETNTVDLFINNSSGYAVTLNQITFTPLPNVDYSLDVSSTSNYNLVTNTTTGNLEIYPLTTPLVIGASTSVSISLKLNLKCNLIPTSCTTCTPIVINNSFTASLTYLGTNYTLNSTHSISVEYPNFYFVSGGPTDNLNYPSFLHDEFNRTITFNIGGTASGTYDDYLSFEDTTPSNNPVVSNVITVDMQHINVAGTIITPIPTTLILGKYVSMSRVHVNQGERIRIIERVRVNPNTSTCINDNPSSNIQSILRLNWGCGNNTCKSSSTNSIIQTNGIAFNLCVFSMIDPSSYTNSCLLPSTTATTGLNPFPSTDTGIYFQPIPGAIRHKFIITDTSRNPVIDPWIKLTPAFSTEATALNNEVIMNNWVRVTLFDTSGHIVTSRSILLSPIQFPVSRIVDGVSLSRSPCMNSVKALYPSPSNYPISELSIKISNSFVINPTTPPGSTVPNKSIMYGGESIIIEYYSYRCCPNDTNKIQSNFSKPTHIDSWQILGGFGGGKMGINDCGGPSGAVFLKAPIPSTTAPIVIIPTGLFRANNIGPACIHLSSFPMSNPTDLTGPHKNSGDPDLCNSSVPFKVENDLFCTPFNYIASTIVANNTNFFQTNTPTIHLEGQLKVIIKTDYGLNLDISPTAISLKDYLTCPTSKFPVISTIIPYGLSGSGGEWELKWDLNDLGSTYALLVSYLNNSVLNFKLAPCCNGEARPDYRIEWYINPYGGSTSCSTCWIPISLNEGKVNLHCPGCVTPGIIVDTCKVIRTTLGLEDYNNDGYADLTGGVTTTHSLTSLTNQLGGPPKTFIQNDILSVDICGFGVDGDNYGGVNYSTLTSNWPALPAGSPTGLINGFNFVNLRFRNTCLSSFNITPELSPTTPLTITLRNSNGVYTYTQNNLTSPTPIIINPVRNTIFISIPISAFVAVDPLNFNPPQITMNDYYSIHFNIKACGNGSPSECETAAHLWWSRTESRESAVDTSAGELNARLNTTSTHTPISKAALFTPNLSYFCEAFGCMNYAYQIKREYNSYWKNSTNDNLASGVTCDKNLYSIIEYKIVDVDETRFNLFPYESRPIHIDFVADNFTLPNPSLVPNYVYDHTSFGSMFNKFTTLKYQKISSYNPPPPTISSVNLTSIPAQYTWTSNPIFKVVDELNATDAIIRNPLNYLFDGDEYSAIYFKHNFIPTTCATSDTQIIPDNTNSNYITTNITSCSTTNATNFINPSSWNYAIEPAFPDLLLYIVGAVPSTYLYGTSTFRVRLLNNSYRNVLANNVSLSLSSSGFINFSHFTKSSSSIIITHAPFSSVITDISNFSQNEWIEFDVEYNLNSSSPTCNPDNFVFTFSSSCSPSMTCTGNTFTISPQVRNFNLNANSSFTTTNVNQCSSATLHNTYTTSDNGEARINSISVDVPNGATITSITPSSGVSLISTLPTITAGIGYSTYTYLIDNSTTPAILQTAGSNTISFDFDVLFSPCATSVMDITSTLNLTSFCGSEINQINHAIVNVVASTSPACTPITNTINTTPVSCTSYNNGSITFTANGSVGSSGVLNFTLNPISAIHPSGSISGTVAPNTSQTINSLEEGTYDLIITDLYGCTQTDRITITRTPSNITIPTVSSQTYTTCEATGTVSWDIDPSLGYTYSFYTDNSTIANSYATAIPITIIGSTITTPSITWARPNEACNIYLIITNPVTGCIEIMNVEIYPCCDEGSILLSNTNVSSNFIATPYYASITGTSYRINGIFTIDDNFTINNCTFYMEPYSQIIVNSNKTLNIKNSVFVACDNVMWKGILLNENANLVSNYGSLPSTKIYDALTGIKTSMGSTYNLENIQMNRNWIDIDVTNYHLTNPNPSRIELSKLYCHLDSPTEYYGSTLPPRDGSLLIPHTGELSYMGIRVDDNRGLFIGPLLSGKKNTIEDKNIGISVQNSSVDIYYNNINSIHNTTSHLGNGIEFFGTEMYSSTKPNFVIIKHNAFTNIDNACIYLNGATVEGYVYKNTIGDINYHSPIGILSENIGTTNSSFLAGDPLQNTLIKSIDIAENNFYSKLNCINLPLSRRILFTIRQNRLEMPTFNGTGTLYPSIGINLSSSTDLFTSNKPYFNIYNNSILYGEKGINIANRSTSSSNFNIQNIIKNNSIETNDDHPNYYGITLDNVNSDINSDDDYMRTNIICNNIVARDGDCLPGTTNKTGIQLINSCYNFIDNNFIRTFYRAFAYQGECSMPGLLRNNNFDNDYIFTEGIGGGATIGTQHLTNSYTSTAGFITPGSIANLFTNNRFQRYNVGAIVIVNPDVNYKIGATNSTFNSNPANFGIIPSASIVPTLSTPITNVTPICVISTFNGWTLRMANTNNSVNSIDNIKFEDVINNNLHNGNQNIIIFPNPTSDILNYFVSENSESDIQIHKIIIKDIQGKIIYSEIADIQTLEGFIDVKKFSDGVYFIEFENSNSTKYIKKFVIQR